MNRRITRWLILGSACGLGLLGVCWWHDQALWNAEDDEWTAIDECRSAVPSQLVPEFSFGGRDVDVDDVTHEGNEPIGRIAGRTFAVEMVGSVRDPCDDPRRRVCRVMMIHDDYHRWRIHSVQLDGEAARVVDYVHVCDMKNDMWLGLYD